jgi:FkbM family methyltransferase
LDDLASESHFNEDRVANLRRLCAIVTSSGFLPHTKRELLAGLRKSPVVLPVPGGCLEFSFGFWRDLWTIATGGWEPNNLSLLHQVLREGDYVVDIGAHVGHFTIYAAHLVGPTGRVIAVEPAPGNVSALQANLERNDICAIVSAVQAALSDTNGKAVIFDDGDTGGTEYSLFPNRHGVRGIAFDTNVLTLDSLVKEHNLERVNFVKMDTEGAELAILLGSSETLSYHGISLLIELHPWVVSPREVCNYLTNKGFNLYHVSDRIAPLLHPDAIDAFYGRLGDIFATRVPLRTD